MGTFGGYTGSMNIPEEMREEFAEQVIKVLNYGGMMQFERISMYGHEMSLLKPVELHPDGKIWFHFNYFEDESWETAGFDANEGIFYSKRTETSWMTDFIQAGSIIF